MTSRAGTFAIAALASLPWLQPFAPGPSPNVVPLLLSWLTAGWLFAALAARSVLIRLSGAMVLLALSMLLPARSLWIAVAAAVVAIAASAAAMGGGAEVRSQARSVALGWLVAALLSAVIGLLQYFGWGALLSPWVASAGLGEAFGNLRQRNQFATLCSVGLVCLLWLSRGWRWPAVLLAMLLLAAANAASASRTGAVQWLLVAIVALIWRGPRRRHWAGWAGVGLAAYAVASLVLPTLLDWLAGQPGINVFSRLAGGPPCGTRSVLWPNVIELTLEAPWLGWGWGELDYAHYAHLYPSERFCDILDNAHNLPLHLAVELGWPLAVAFCAAAACWVARRKPWREAEAHRRVAWLVILVIGLHSLVEYPVWYGPFQLALGLSLGILWRPAGRRPTEVAVPAAARVWVALLIAGMSGYAAWDYHRISQLYLSAEERAEPYRLDTLTKAKESKLFRDQVLFAELSVTPLTRANARYLHGIASELIHFSPEPRVISLLADSALLLGLQAEAAWHIQRFRAAFPEEYRTWANERGLVP